MQDTSTRGLDDQGLPPPPLDVGPLSCGPLLIVDWGVWPRHLQFTTHRYHEIGTNRKFKSRRTLRAAALGRGWVLHYLNARGIYVPFHWERPPT